jgi:hypothetical protein
MNLTQLLIDKLAIPLGSLLIRSVVGETAGVVGGGLMRVAERLALVLEERVPRRQTSGFPFVRRGDAVFFGSSGTSALRAVLCPNGVEHASLGQSEAGGLGSWTFTTQSTCAG